MIRIIFISPCNDENILKCCPVQFFNLATLSRLVASAKSSYARDTHGQSVFGVLWDFSKELFHRFHLVFGTDFFQAHAPLQQFFLLSF